MYIFKTKIFTCRIGLFIKACLYPKSANWRDANSQRRRKSVHPEMVPAAWDRLVHILLCGHQLKVNSLSWGLDGVIIAIPGSPYLRQWMAHYVVLVSRPQTLAIWRSEKFPVFVKIIIFQLITKTRNIKRFLLKKTHMSEVVFQIKGLIIFSFLKRILRAKATTLSDCESVVNISA